MEVYHSVVSPAEVTSWLMMLSYSSSATALSSASPCSTPFSPSLSRLRARKRHLAMAFSHSQEHVFLPTPSVATAPASIIHHVRAMHCAGFITNRCKCFCLLSAERMQLSRSHVRAKASVGRLSGAVHGSNSRKRRSHKRSETIRQDNSQELECPHGSEMHDEPTSEHAHSVMFYDDVSDDQHSECPVDHGTSNWSSSLIASTGMYDSIHGDFWINDPYYQEFEASFSEDGTLNLKDESLSEDKYLLENQGGEGASLASEYVNPLDFRCVPPTTAAQAHSPVSEETCETFQKPVGVAERDLHARVDHKETSYDQINIGEDLVRKVESAERPLINFCALQTVEVNNSGYRAGSANGEIDETHIEYRTDAKGSLPAVDVSFQDPKADMAIMADDSVGEVTALTDAVAHPVVEQAGQALEQVTDLIPDSIKGQGISRVGQADKLPEQLPKAAEEVVLKMVDEVAEVLPDPVLEQVGQLAEQVAGRVAEAAEQVTQTAEQLVEQASQTAEQLVEQATNHVVDPISTTASQISNLLSSDDYEEESDDEFEAYTSLDIPEFKGQKGLNNFTILQEEHGFLSIIYDFYIFMLKQSLFEFLLGMFAAPILLSMIFTVLYLPQFSGLALDENLKEFLQNSDESASGLQLSWQTVFQVFMFSVSLSTGLQPELSPLSPYTLVVANVNALFAQLIFVFLSGAVFARLSQPSQPVKCSTVALVSPPSRNRRLRKEACYKALLTRYVLVGPQPCELVDVKVDLTYHYNTVTRSGTYFRTSESLKLVRPEIAFLDHGMLVRHIIDETSPLYQRSQEMLEKEDAVFSLSVVALERSSMQSVFHVQHYCVYDKDVVWDAEFVDMILINKKNRRIVDHSLVSTWRKVIPS